MGILMGLPENTDPLAVSLDYCKTVNANVETFLANKTNVMQINLETAKHDFEIFWNWIGAEGDLNSALSEFDIKHNAS